MTSAPSPQGSHCATAQLASTDTTTATGSACDSAARLLGAIGDMLLVGGAILDWSVPESPTGAEGLRLTGVEWVGSSRLLLSMGDGQPLTSRSAMKLVAQPRRRELLRAIRESAQSHQSFRRTVPITRTGAGTGWVEVSCTVELEAGGGCTMTLVFQNVTKAKLRESRLRHELVRKEQMAQMAGIGTWTIELDSGELTWSEEVFRIHEFEPGLPPTVGEAVAFYAPEDARRVEEGLQRLIDDGTQYDLVLPIITARGNRRWVHAMAELEPDSDGRAATIIGCVRDITEQHEAQAQLQASEERYMFALDGARDGIWDVDLVKDETHFSTRWKTMLGYEEHEISNDLAEWVRRVPKDQRTRALKAFEDYVDGIADHYRAEFQMRHKDGSWRWVLSRGQVVARDEHGQPTRIVGTHTDITEQVEMREHLIAAKEAAEEAAHAKSDFLATMSHEIRTPLNGILGLTQVLLETDLDAGQADYLNVILGSGTALLEILNDILDLSRTEAGKLRLEEVAFSPAECARSTIELLRHAAAKEKGIRLELCVDDAVPPTILGDPARLRQVLLNLVGNAIKFTNEGFVRITVSTLAGEGGASDLIISVRDTGIGISQKDAARLFEAFTQADSTTTRRFGGTGLGLSISRNLIHLMGGVIGCRPDLRGGSVFWVEIPIRLAGEEAIVHSLPPVTTAGKLTSTLPKLEVAELSPEKNGSPSDGHNVLVVEDNPINQVVARRMLAKMGCTVVTVADGQQAVDATNQTSFDVVFMDCSMPVMDGLEATRRIRTREAEQGLDRVPIVAMTANAMASDRDACLEAGMDDYVSKPVLANVLQAALERALRSRGAA